MRPNHRLLVLLLTALLLTISVAGVLLLLGCNGDGNGRGTTNPTPGEPTWGQIVGVPGVLTFERIWGLSASDIYAVGGDGLVYHGNGSVWDSVPGVEDPDRHIYGVWGGKASQIFFAGSSVERDTNATQIGDTTLLLDYNGVDFEAVNIGISSWLYDIYGTDTSNIYAVGDSGRIVHYDGSTWTALTAPGTVQLYGVWASDSLVFACGQYGTLLQYNSNTDSLRVLSTHNAKTLWDIWGFSDSSVYIVGSSGTILHWDGSSISKMTSSDQNTLYSVWGASEGQMFAVGSGGKIYGYDGATWSEMTSPTEFGLVSVWGTNASNVYAIGKTALRYNGSAWEFVEVRPQPTIYDVWTPSRSEALAVGSYGTIYKFTGLQWVKQESGTDTTLHGVWGDPNSSTRYAAGDGGTVLRYDGAAWTDMNTGISTDFRSISGFSDSTIWAVGTNGTIASYDGTSWSVDTVIGSTTLNDIWASSSVDSGAIAVGDNGEVWLYAPSLGYSKWTKFSFPNTVNLNAAWFRVWGELYVVADGGRIFNLYGSGADLQSSEMVSPTSVDLNGMWGIMSSTENRIFAAGDGGTVLSYEFSGTGWVIQDSPTTVDLYALYGVTGSSVIAGGAWNHILAYSR